jgi:hypothetical protein
MIATILAATVYALVALFPDGVSRDHKDKWATLEECLAVQEDMAVKYPQIVSMKCEQRGN